MRVTATESVELNAEDLAELHDLRCRAADFFAETGDAPPSLESLRADLEELPEGFTRADEIVYRAYPDPGEHEGARGENRRLVGYAEVLRGWPDEDAWIIGLLLVDASRRGSGIGALIAERVARDARDAGMRQLAVGVITSRERSLSFWKREGFTREVHRRPLQIGDTEHEVVRLVRDL